MNTDGSPEQIAQCRQQGYLLIEWFLDGRELEHWRAVTEAAMRLRLAGTALNNQADPEAFYAQGFTQCLNLRNIHAGMAELMYDERLGRLAGTLAGVDGMRVWHDQALVKPPYGNHTSFHFDDPFWSFYSHDA